MNSSESSPRQSLETFKVGFGSLLWRNWIKQLELEGFRLKSLGRVAAAAVKEFYALRSPGTVPDTVIWDMMDEQRAASLNLSETSQDDTDLCWLEIHPEITAADIDAAITQAKSAEM